MEERPPFYYDPHPEGNRVSRDLEKSIEESTKSLKKVDENKSQVKRTGVPKKKKNDKVKRNNYYATKIYTL